MEPAREHLEAGSPFVKALKWAPRLSLVEAAPERLCQAALVVMIVMISAEVFSRGIIGVSLEVSDELGGYLLVAITFLSLPFCQVGHAFHRVEFVQARLSERGRAFSELAFDLLSFAFSAVVFWQFTRLGLRTWVSGDVAPTNLMTPLWVPRLSMPVGTGLLCLTLLRTLWRDLRRIAALHHPGAGPG